MEKEFLDSLLQLEEVQNNKTFLIELKKTLDYLASNNQSVKYKHDLSVDMAEFLLKHKVIDAEQILVRSFIYNDTNHNQMVDLALKHKVDFNKIDNLSRQISALELERFLDNGLDLTKAAEWIFHCSINKYDAVSEKHIPDEDKIKLQGDLIKFILDKGANIGDSDIHISIENLYNHYDLLLNHPSNPLTQELAFKKALTNCWIMDNATGKFVLETQYNHQKAELIERLYEDANHSLDISEIESIDASVATELSNRALIDDQTMLKLALKASGIKNFEDKSYYDLEAVELQKQLIEVYLAKDLGIEDLSFKELNIKNNHISIEPLAKLQLC